MNITDLSFRFRKELGDAVSQWNLGDEQPMVDLVNRVLKEGFHEGMVYTQEYISGLEGSEDYGQRGKQ